MSGLLHVLAHLATGCATLVAAMQLGLLTPSARVVEVDTAAALRAFEDRVGPMPEARFRELSLRFTDAMQLAADLHARRHGVVVVETSLAIAGAQDVTTRLLADAAEFIPELKTGSGGGPVPVAKATVAAPSSEGAGQ